MYKKRPSSQLSHPSLTLRHSLTPANPPSPFPLSLSLAHSLTRLFRCRLSFSFSLVSLLQHPPTSTSISPAAATTVASVTSATPFSQRFSVRATALLYEVLIFQTSLRRSPHCHPRLCDLSFSRSLATDLGNQNLVQPSPPFSSSKSAPGL